MKTKTSVVDAMTRKTMMDVVVMNKVEDVRTEVAMIKVDVQVMEVARRTRVALHRNRRNLLMPTAPKRVVDSAVKRASLH